MVPPGGKARGEALVRAILICLDTRKKIVEPGAIPRDGRAVELIIGYFDPVWACTVERLRSLCRTDAITVAAVGHPPDPLLPWRARAELVAALACVDYVVDAARAGELTGANVADERESDAERSRQLATRILKRQSGE